MYNKLIALIKMVRQAPTLGDCMSWYSDIQSTITILFVLSELTSKQADDLTAKLLFARMDRATELRAQALLKEGGRMT